MNAASSDKDGTCAVDRESPESPDYLPALSVLKGHELERLERPDDGMRTRVRSEELWKDRPCLIYLVRRPGCILCRNEAVELVKIHEQMALRGVDMAAVVHEADIGEFAQKYWPGLPIYLNADRSFFSAINSDRRLRKQNVLGGLLSMDTWRRYARARDAGVTGNMRGEGRILGGLVLMGRGEEGAQWVRLENSFGDYPSSEEILAAVAK